MINVGILGGTGFTGGELLRILAYHPKAQVKWVYSRTNAGDAIQKIHEDLDHFEHLNFTNILDWEIDVLFMCLPHGATAAFLEQNNVPAKIKIIDLSNDFRLNNREGFIYGLPELNKDQIIRNNKIANPGCFATALQLAILPLASENMLHSDIHVTAITGSTGAGKELTPTSHFTWRTGNLSVYKVMKHQHIAEIVQSITQLQKSFNQKIVFVPMRGNFTRGILASIYTKCTWTQEQTLIIFKNFYKDQPFIHITDQPIDMKQIINTNNVKISVQIIDGYLHIVSTIDNLIKGASGQAIQNMNLVCGFPENLGLNLKSIAY